jgi:hypothetical protein
MTLSTAWNEAVTAKGRFRGGQLIAHRMGTVRVISRHELRTCQRWQHAFASQHKDHRYYELINDTIHPEFDYLYFELNDLQGKIRAVPAVFYPGSGYSCRRPPLSWAVNRHHSPPMAAIYVYEDDDGRVCCW